MVRTGMYLSTKHIIGSNWEQVDNVKAACTCRYSRSECIMATWASKLFAASAAGASKWDDDDDDSDELSPLRQANDPRRWTCVEQPQTPELNKRSALLLRDRSVALLLFKQQQQQQQRHHTTDPRLLWEALDPELQRDPDVAMAALLSGSLADANDLPVALRGDRAFWLSLMLQSNSGKWWNQLPFGFL